MEVIYNLGTHAQKRRTKNSRLFFRGRLQESPSFVKQKNRARKKRTAFFMISLFCTPKKEKEAILFASFKRENGGKGWFWGWGRFWGEGRLWSSQTPSPFTITHALLVTNALIIYNHQRPNITLYVIIYIIIYNRQNHPLRISKEINQSSEEREKHSNKQRRTFSSSDKPFFVFRQRVMTKRLGEVWPPSFRWRYCKVRP